MCLMIERIWYEIDIFCSNYLVNDVVCGLRKVNARNESENAGPTVKIAKGRPR